MSNFYDDSKYGVLQRTWFGLTPKVGGSQAAGITLGTTATTTAITTPTRWYPKGTILMKKVGFRVLATVYNASSAARPLRVTTRGASASAGAFLRPSTCSMAQYSIASTTTFTVAQVKAGEYVTFKWASGQTIKGGVAAGTQKKNTTTGTVAIFVDWVPQWGAQWDV